MTDRTDPDDDVIVPLRRTLDAVDPPPAELLASGRAVFGLHRVDDELAALVADSLVDAAPVRADAMPERVLSFAAGDLTVDVQLSGSPPGRLTLLGEIDPPTVATVVVEALPTTGPVELPVDTDGRFSGELAAGATVRLRLARSGRAAVTTPWFTT